MPTINIIFATNSGGTAAASQIISDTLTALNLNPVIKQAVESTATDLESADVILLGSPSWDYENKEGYPHEDMIKFMDSCTNITLPGKRFAIFGLGDSSYMHFCGAVDHLEEFVKKLGGTLLTPSIRIDGFYYNQEKSSQTLKDWATQLGNIINKPSA